MYILGPARVGRQLCPHVPTTYLPSKVSFFLNERLRRCPPRMTRLFFRPLSTRRNIIFNHIRTFGVVFDHFSLSITVRNLFYCYYLTQNSQVYTAVPFLFYHSFRGLKVYSSENLFCPAGLSNSRD